MFCATPSPAFPISCAKVRRTSAVILRMRVYAGVFGMILADFYVSSHSSWHAQVSHDEGRFGEQPIERSMHTKQRHVLPRVSSSHAAIPPVFLISPSSCPRKSLHMASTRAVSWPMFSPLSVTKWPTYHTNPSKFASNREILFCANEPKKRENASK